MHPQISKLKLMKDVFMNKICYVHLLHRPITGRVKQQQGHLRRSAQPQQVLLTQIELFGGDTFLTSYIQRIKSPLTFCKQTHLNYSF